MSRLLEYFDMMEVSMHKLDEALREIVDHSKNSRVDIAIEKINIKELIRGCIEKLQYLDGAQEIDFQILMVGPHTVYCGVYRLGIIFSNLISNAIKYRNKYRKSFFRISIEANTETVQFDIRDNGIGVHEDALPKIFDMFYRATDRSQGAGLGLYIVKEAIEKLGGTITAESDVTIGTNFHISLPYGSEKQEPNSSKSVLSN